MVKKNWRISIDFKTALFIISLFLGGSLPATQTSYAGETTFEGDLPRSALREFQISTSDGGSIYDSPFLEVSGVTPGSVEEAAGLKAGDILKTLNGETFRLAIDMSEALGNLPGNIPLSLEIERNGVTFSIEYTPPPVPPENLPGVNTVYGVLDSATGLTLRTILTIPENAEGKLPGILFSDWTSCNSIELPLHRQRGFINVPRHVAQKLGVVFLRIEKPGVGDSLGRCSELDVDTTIAYQKEGLEILRQHPNVDPSKLFVYGKSLGSMLAPLVAEGENVLGVFGVNGAATTWFERMLFFERMQRELADIPAAEIDQDMKDLTAFYYHYLIEQKTPEEIIAEKPEMARVWAEEISHNSKTKHYGRPVSFHHQMQQKNFAEAWIKANAETLLVVGEYDQFESVDAAATAINVINAIRPGTARLVVIPFMNHQAELYPNRKAALIQGSTPVVGAEIVFEEIQRWFSTVLEKHR